MPEQKIQIDRVVVKNYRTLRDLDLVLYSDVNIVVGDNESGKSTLLEAINLALKCQINRRPAAYELHPFLLNQAAVSEFIKAHQAGTKAPPPSALIELYFAKCDDLADLEGTNNSVKENVPGIRLSIHLDPDCVDEYKDYISDPTKLRTIPTDLYKIEWKSFSGNPMNARRPLVRSVLVDPSAVSNSFGANKYMLEVIQDSLSKKEKANLSLSYRRLHDSFLEDKSVKEINTELSKKKGSVSDKEMSVGMDATARAGWEASVLPHLDEIPLTLVGKGEQSSVKIRLALAAPIICHTFLIEEPENHLSHSNLNRLIGQLSEDSSNKQIIITTHSSFVLNKMGVDNVIMFNGASGVTLSDLPAGTKAYFKKLPGHNTLRMLLAKRTILVEGPSDELIVQKAYHQTHGRMPLEDCVEVIAVNSLAFKRFLDIATLLKLQVCVVTDNDGDSSKVAKKYENYAGTEFIEIHSDQDDSCTTLEPQLLKVNGRASLNALLEKNYDTEADLLSYMETNKADVALKIFDSETPFEIPEYIANAVK